MGSFTGVQADLDFPSETLVPESTHVLYPSSGGTSQRALLTPRLIIGTKLFRSLWAIMLTRNLGHACLHMPSLSTYLATSVAPLLAAVVSDKDSSYEP